MIEEDPIDIVNSLGVTKEILAIITISFCFFLLIIYFISCLQIKCSFLAKKEPISVRKTFLDKTSVHSSKIKNQKKKIGLGSHYIFFLIFSNFLSEIVELTAILYYKNRTVDPENEDDDFSCQLFGFAHNFFDLSSVCWTSMLALLFYNSTKLKSQMFFKDKKYLIIGILYNIISCGIFCVIPYFRECFGFARTYCTFYQPIETDETRIKIKVMLWKYAFVIFILINTIYNIFCFHKTTKFYSTKLSLLKKQNRKEYILVLIFVRVFQLFSITLIVSRLIKFICIVMLDFSDTDVKNFDNFQIFMIFSNAIIFNLNGTFNSIGSIFFFRGVFWCCISTDSDVRNVEKKEQDEKKVDEENEEEEKEEEEKEDEEKNLVKKEDEEENIEYKNDEDSINGK